MADLTWFPEGRRRDLVRGALHFWRKGDLEVRAPHRQAQRMAYERAIVLLLSEMRHLTTMDVLVNQYLFDRAYLSLATERACRAIGASKALSRIWVRDAAFWRRLRCGLEDLAA
jgi:hypothetical protein